MVETATVEKVTTETRKFDGRMESAYGRDLPKAIDFEGTYEHIMENAAIPAKEVPTDEEILAFVNRKRLANARQKAMQAALDAAGVKKPDLKTDVQLQLETLIKVYVAAGKSPEEAQAIAESTLGAKLED